VNAIGFLLKNASTQIGRTDEKAPGSSLPGAFADSADTYSVADVWISSVL
jgi:hypothetical protein